MSTDRGRVTGRTHNNLLGTWLMLAGFASFSCADLIAKLLTADFHPVQIALTRQLGVIAVVLLWFVLRGPAILKSAAPKWQILRGLFAIVSAICFIFSLSYVPLADAVAVSFVAPFMVTVLGAALLGEAVGTRRWIAVAAGFAGALVIIRPGAGVFHPAIFLVLLAAAAFAGRQIISRPLGARDPTMTTLAYTALTSVVLLAVPLPWFWSTPDAAAQIGLMAGMAVLAGLGEYLLIRALEIAYAVVVAPMQYSLILYAALWGYLVFGDLPDRWTWIGTAIIIASGLYMMHLERRERPTLIR